MSALCVSPMPYPYVTVEELRARIGGDLLDRALDDDDDGQADVAVMQEVIADASAKVAGTLRGNYDLGVVAENTPREVKRLTLELATCYIAQRHPEVVRFDWEPRMKQVNTDLKAIRSGENRLDAAGPPEPSANQGGDYFPDPMTNGVRVFIDGMGDF